MRLSVVQQIAGVLCFALVVLIVAANLGCAPKYFQRGDVIAGLALGLFDGILLLGASSGDSDTHRVVGVAASAGATALFLATASIPVLFAPLAIAGAFRLPRSGRQRVAGFVAIPFGIIGTAVLVYFGQSFVSPSQFICP